MFRGSKPLPPHGSDVADHEFELRDVPWVMYFKGATRCPRPIARLLRSPTLPRLREPRADRRALRVLWSHPTVPEHWQRLTRVTHEPAHPFTYTLAARGRQLF